MNRTLRTVVSVVLLVAVAWLLDWAQLRAAVQTLRPGGLALALVLTLAVFGLLGLRWWIMVGRQVRLPAAVHLRHYLHATFANALTPANLGGDAYRILALREAAGGAVPVFAAVVRERYLGLLTYLVMFFVCLPGAWDPALTQRISWHDPLTVAAAACAIALALLVWAPEPLLRLARRITALRRSVWTSDVLDAVLAQMRSGSRAERATIAGLSVAGAVLWIGAVLVVSRGLGAELGWSAIGVIAILTELVRMVPISLQGIGVREGAFAWLFPVFGQPPELGFLTAAISYLVLNCALIAAGLLAMLLPRDAGMQ